MDECPTFSRTVLTASPLLQYLHLESGEARPLPNPALGLLRLSPSKAQIRRTSFPLRILSWSCRKHCSLSCSSTSALCGLPSADGRGVGTKRYRFSALLRAYKRLLELAFRMKTYCRRLCLLSRCLGRICSLMRAGGRIGLIAPACTESCRAAKRGGVSVHRTGVAGAEQPYVPVRRTSITGAHHIQHRTTGDELPVRHAVATTVQGQVQSSSSPPKPSSASILDQRPRGPGFLTGKSSANVLGHA